MNALCAFSKAYVCLPPPLLLNTLLVYTESLCEENRTWTCFLCLHPSLALMPVVLTYCHKRLFLDWLHVCVCASAPPNFNKHPLLPPPPPSSTVWLYREKLLVCLVFCTESVYLTWFVTKKVKWGEKKAIAFFRSRLLQCDRARNVSPIDPGAHVQPKTQHIRSCKHTINICLTMWPSHTFTYFVQS